MWMVDPIEWLGGFRDPVTVALLLGAFATMTTTAGALTVHFFRHRKASAELVLDVGLGFSSGVMITASFTSLLLPAIEIGGVLPAVMGMVLGALAIHGLNSVVPHEHMVKGFEGPAKLVGKVRSAWLVAMAIIIHNLPEGMAIGASTAESVANGIAVGVAISVQDIPEGLAVALPIALIKGSAWVGVLYGFLSGASELALSAVAVLMGTYAVLLLPYLLGFAAGAMIYVVSHEAIPESHRTGHEKPATLGFFVGFIIMLYLDTVLG